MNSKDFESIVNTQLERCKDILLGKAKEYARDDDRLHNFKNAAGMMGCDPKEALAGMMAKHTISIYDMCRDGEEHSLGLWTEKITDHINYLLLLKALIMEEKGDSGKLHRFTQPVMKVVKPGDKVEFDCGLIKPPKPGKPIFLCDEGDPKKNVDKGLSGVVKDWDKTEKYWAKRIAESLDVCSDKEGEKTCDSCLIYQCHGGCPETHCDSTLMQHAKIIIEKYVKDSEEKND